MSSKEFAPVSEFEKLKSENELLKNQLIWFKRQLFGKSLNILFPTITKQRLTLVTTL